MTLDDVFRETVEAFEADQTKAVRITPEQLKRHVPEAHQIYREKKASAGNAKARRRWRRRSVPNTQRASAQRAPVAECRMCAAFQTGQMGERSYCAEHAAEAVRMYSSLPPLRGAP